MGNDTFMDKLRMFFGLRPPEPPRNDFRNPIWGSDDDDDGDELYTRQQNLDVYPGDLDMHREITKHMQDMLRSFGSMFGDMRSFFHDENLDTFSKATITELPADNEKFDSSSIRDYYLKPGFHNNKPEEHKDIDLDGKISSQEISGLLNKKDGPIPPTTHFDGRLVPGRAFCQTIITTSITKPDGTIETRRIVKNGNEIIEETTTSAPDTRSPHKPGLDPISSTGIIMSELASIFRNFY